MNTRIFLDELGSVCTVSCWQTHRISWFL